VTGGGAGGLMKGNKTMKTELWAIPASGVKIDGKIARPYRLQNTKSVRGLKKWLEFLPHRHGATIAGIEKRDAETGNTISFHRIVK
jgi:hypothetical protein